jgi:hypothetical protein
MSYLSFSLRRVNKEIENFKIKNYNTNKISFFLKSLTFKIFTENNKNYLIIYDNYLDVFTQLEIPQSYPFRPYNVVYFNSKNKVPYLSNLNFITELFKNRDTNIYAFFYKCMFSITPKFLNLKKNDCYCCNSFMCINEWSPNLTFTNLLLEHIEIKFIECYSSKIGYKYIKYIYDALFTKLPDEIIFNIINYL